MRQGAVAIVLAILAAGCGGSRAPSDEEAIRHFLAHRAEFDSLVLLVERDRTLEQLPATIHTGWTDDWTPAQFESRGDLQRRMKRLGLWGLSGRSTSGGMEFPASPHRPGIEKRYVRAGRRTPEPVVASLDGPGDRLWAYRQIDGPWYLRLDMGD